MKYSITLVKITKNVSGPVSINFVSLARALLWHERCFGTSVSSPAGEYEALSNASQREVNKASGTSLLVLYSRQTSLLSWSQIFPQVGKRAFCSADNENLLESQFHENMIV